MVFGRREKKHYAPRVIRLYISRYRVSEGITTCESAEALHILCTHVYTYQAEA